MANRSSQAGHVSTGIDLQPAHLALREAPVTDVDPHQPVVGAWHRVAEDTGAGEPIQRVVVGGPEDPAVSDPEALGGQHVVGTQVPRSEGRLGEVRRVLCRVTEVGLVAGLCR